MNAGFRIRTGTVERVCGSVKQRPRSFRAPMKNHTANDAAAIPESPVGGTNPLAEKILIRPAFTSDARQNAKWPLTTPEGGTINAPLFPTANPQNFRHAYH
jgi:hypothetical protein